MPRFRTKKEAKEWGQKMKEARAKKKLVKNPQPQVAIPEVEEPKVEEIATSEVKEADALKLPEIPGKVWVQHVPGDKLAVPEWLAEDLIKKGVARKI